MKICEIFTSIQGETTYAGLPSIFIRTTGCNLRCSYCDTVYAYEEGSELTEDEIVDNTDAIGLRTVVITGGEPLLHEGTFSLARRLLDGGHTVLIETNGSKDISAMDARAVIILDIKTPGSGMDGTLLRSNLSYLKREDQAKLVMADRRDYEWAKDFVMEHSLARKCQILFAPAYGMLDPRDLSRWMIHDRLEVRLNLQLHKYIHGPDTRGV